MEVPSIPCMLLSLWLYNTTDFLSPFGVAIMVLMSDINMMWGIASCEYALSLLSLNPRRSPGRLCLHSHCHPQASLKRNRSGHGNHDTKTWDQLFPRLYHWERPPTWRDGWPISNLKPPMLSWDPFVGLLALAWRSTQYHISIDSHSVEKFPYTTITFS